MGVLASVLAVSGCGAGVPASTASLDRVALDPSATNPGDGFREQQVEALQIPGQYVGQTISVQQGNVYVQYVWNGYQWIPVTPGYVTRIYYGYPYGGRGWGGRRDRDHRDRGHRDRGHRDRGQRDRGQGDRGQGDRSQGDRGVNR